jgi:aspartyl-tRNA synthetase
MGQLCSSCVNSHCTNGRVPPVMLALAAIASAAVKSSGERVRRRYRHLRFRMKRRSSGERSRHRCTKPTRASSYAERTSHFSTPAMPMSTRPNLPWK